MSVWNQDYPRRVYLSIADLATAAQLGSWRILNQHEKYFWEAFAMGNTAETSRKTLTPFDGVLVTIRSDKSFKDVTEAIEARLQRFSIPKLMEYITSSDRAGLEAYVETVSQPTRFSIFWEFEQGSTMRLAGIPVESKFYLVGNAVIARGLFRYSGAAGLSAPVRICVSRLGDEQTRIDLDLPSAFFAKFPEMTDSDVPALLDAEMVRVFEEAAA